VICSGLTAHLIWVPATFRLCSQHFTVKLWLPQMLPNFGYGRQKMPTDVKKKGLPQMSANRPNIGSTWKIDLRKLSKGVSSRTLFVFPVFFHLCFRCFFMFFRFFCFLFRVRFHFLFSRFFHVIFHFLFFVSFSFSCFLRVCFHFRFCSHFLCGGICLFSLFFTFAVVSFFVFI
jgi:hypothetical protein